MERDGIGAAKARLLRVPGRLPNPGATPELRRRAYFHGTQDPFAHRVLRSWTLEPRSHSGALQHRPQTWLDPLEGRVYLAQDPKQAFGYLSITRDHGGYPVGLLVEVDGRNLGEVHPDEDAVGRAVYIAAAGNYWEAQGVEQGIGEAMWVSSRAQLPYQTPWAKHFVELAKRHLTKRQLEYVMGEWGDPPISVLAKVGKKLLPYLSDDDQTRLMELGVAIANMGPVPISRAWACPSQVPWNLRREGWEGMRSACIEVVDEHDYARARAELLDELSAATG